MSSKSNSFSRNFFKLNKNKHKLHNQRISYFDYNANTIYIQDIKLGVINLFLFIILNLNQKLI